MFFLIRMGFWLGLVLLLLPLGLKGQSGQDVSVIEAFGAFQAVVADARGFCARQPEACAVGGQMASHLMEKAQVGAKWLYQAVGEPTRGEAFGQGGGPGSSQAIGQGAGPAGTQQAHPAAFGLDTSAMPAAGQLQLTPQDLLPAWGGGESVRRAPAAVPASTTPAPLPPRRPA